MSGALMSHDDRVMHLPGDTYGRAACGETMREPWMNGPIDAIAVAAIDQCEDCFDFT